MIVWALVFGAGSAGALEAAVVVAAVAGVPALCSVRTGPPLDAAAGLVRGCVGVPSVGSRLS